MGLARSRPRARPRRSRSRLSGINAPTLTNDLDFTLNQLNLLQFSSGAVAVATSLNGVLAFGGNSPVIQMLGPGNATTGGPITFSSPVTIGSGITGTNALRITGSGLGNLTFGSTAITSNGTSTPLVIDLGATVPTGGIVTFNAGNTFTGGIILNGGNLERRRDCQLGLRRRQRPEH